MTKKLQEYIEQAEKMGACWIPDAIRNCHSIEDALWMMHGSDAAWVYLFLNLPKSIEGSVIAAINASGAMDILGYAWGAYRPSPNPPKSSPKKRAVLIDLLDLYYYRELEIHLGYAPRADQRLLKKKLKELNGE